MAELAIAARLARWRVPLGFACGGVVLWLARPTPVTLAIGAVFAAFGEGFRLWAAGHLNKGREVTASGPYRWCSHPLYVGSSVLGAGLAIASGRVVVAVLVLAYLATTLAAAIKTEEVFLKDAFGDGYTRYRLGAVDLDSRFRLSQALANGEHRTVVGIAIVLGLLFVKMSRSV